MKLYDGGRAPNPRRVRVFIAEKGLSIPVVPVDMGAFGHKSPEITRLNPLQRLPVLELDDGTILTESIAICRYLEDLHPDPPLFGTGSLERAKIEMWQRRMEFELLYTVAQAFRHLHPAMRAWEVPQIAEWGEANKPKALKFLAFLDTELAGRSHVAGDAFSIADITGLIGVDFMKLARIPMPEDLANVRRWHEQLSARPSAKA